MNSKLSVLPNFLKTASLAGLLAFSASALAGHHEKKEDIGDLKDMKKETKSLSEDELKLDWKEENKNAKEKEWDKAKKKSKIKEKDPE